MGIYHCVSRITAAPSAHTSAYSGAHEATAATNLFFQSYCTYKTAVNKTRGTVGGSKNNSPNRNNICKISVHSPEWHHAEDRDIFFEWQCNTKHVSIAFTWMLRLANFLQKLNRWRRCSCLSLKIKTYLQNRKINKILKSLKNRKDTPVS